MCVKTLVGKKSIKEGKREREKKREIKGEKENTNAKCNRINSSLHKVPSRGTIKAEAAVQVSRVTFG